MAGTDFYFYVFKMYSSQKPQIDPIAYSDNTLVQLIDVTDTPMTGSGYTSVVDDDAGTVIGSWELDAGEDLLDVNGLTVSLDVGHTYHLLANKKVTLQYGTLGHSTYGRRDGGAYVPSKNGYSAGRTFYFGIPYDKGKDREREWRFVTYDDGADVSVRGWNTTTSQWDDVHTTTLGPHGHLELIGDELGDDYYFFEVKATANVSVFETNWFETGSYGTSDIATYISSAAGPGAGRRFEAYLGPPANEPNLETGRGSTTLTHLYVFANEETNVVVYDPDGYVIVHLGDGADSQTDLYAGAGSAGALDDTEDQIALFAGDELVADEMLDFVHWDSNGILGDSALYDLAVATNQWPSGGWVQRNLSAGRTLGRDQYSADTNDPVDWENTGGVDSGVPSPGGVNWSNPTAVTLGYFRAVRAPDGVRLEWETTSEVDNVGFNVYRSETLMSHRYRLNDVLIPSRSPGGLLGATYTYLDTQADPEPVPLAAPVPGASPRYYWLEDVDVAGHTALHTPTHYDGGGAPATVLYLPLVMRR